MPRHVVQDLCKWGCFDLKYTMCSQDFFKWRVVFEGPQDSLPDLSESYQNWVPEWDVEILVRKHHLSRHLLKSTEDNSKIFKANWNEWNGRLGIPQTSPDENTRYEGGIFSAVLNFPGDFPNNPPEMKLSPQWLRSWMLLSCHRCHRCHRCQLCRLLEIAAPCRVRFETEMWHPNIYPDGRVCISILHPPGTDRFNDQAKPWWEVFSRCSQIDPSFNLFSFRKPLTSGGDLSWEFTAFWSVCDP